MGAPNSSNARSRLSIAMLTPAQKPRGLARMIFTSTSSWGCGYPTAAATPLPTAPGLAPQPPHKRRRPARGCRAGRRGGRRQSGGSLEFDLGRLDGLLAVLLADR